MRLIGVLSWYDESAAWLAASVAGYGRLCDVIIAVDGAYELYPQGRSHSMPDQREAIMAAAEAVGCGCIVYQPQTTWVGNEVAKRNQIVDLVRSIGTEWDDWMVVFDSDYQVMQLYPEMVRDLLASTDLNVATYTLLDGQDLLANQESARVATEIDVSSEWTARVRGCYRLLPNLRYEQKHWYIVGDGKDGPEVLFGPPVKEAQALRLENSMVVYHRRKDRSIVRLRAGETYYRVRDELQAEGGDLVLA